MKVNDWALVVALLTSLQLAYYVFHRFIFIFYSSIGEPLYRNETFVFVSDLIGYVLIAGDFIILFLSIKLYNAAKGSSIFKAKIK